MGQAPPADLQELASMLGATTLKEPPKGLVLDGELDSDGPTSLTPEEFLQPMAPPEPEPDEDAVKRVRAKMRSKKFTYGGKVKPGLEKGPAVTDFGIDETDIGEGVLGVNA